MITELEDRIRERAHEIWENEGRPAGRAEAHWSMASAEIAAVGQKAAPDQSASKKAPAKPRAPRAAAAAAAAAPGAEKVEKASQAKSPRPRAPRA
jgi:hypothetical protein